MSELRAAVFMCHAPIVIPAIAGPRASDCEATTKAMHRAAEHVVAGSPETVVIVSPHLPRHPMAFGWAKGPTLSVNFQDFGHPELRREFSQDPEAIHALITIAEGEGLTLRPTSLGHLDHGTGVPAWFLHDAGFQGHLLVLGLPWQSHPEALHRLGSALTKAFQDLARPWALVASGDLSHALRPGAPAGYHPRAADFDATLMDHLRQGSLEALDHLDPELRRIAAEDAVESLQVARGALGPEATCQAVLSYQAPFGVGYGVGLFR